MKCEDIQIRLDEFIDNELDIVSSQAVKGHIEKCQSCFGETESIRWLKHQLVSSAPSLSEDFDLKLQERINKANSKSDLRKFLPIAASIALIAPLVYFLKLQPPVEVQNKYILELQSLGKTAFNDIENFHVWTQSENSDENLKCSSATLDSYCSIDLLNFPKI